uniref:Uncharacterized protein n=1 Tax=Amphimedon queenslandica TaxID=400682 RepID=A0A1X7UB20_AMPQE
MHTCTTTFTKFHQKYKERILSILQCFLIHIHVLMLRRNFELIPFKIKFLNKFLKLLQMSCNALWC